MSKKRGLGRGLDALLGGESAVSKVKPSEGDLRQIPVERIQRGTYQPRSVIREEGLRELADSIRMQGVVQPVIVRPFGEDENGQRYELIAGERRWRASQLAGLDSVPAVIRDVPDEAAVAMSLIENIQREDLNPLEESTALKRLLDEFGMTHEQAAAAVGRSRAAVTNLLRLQDLNGDVKSLVDDQELQMGHARALLGLKGVSQSKAARTVASKGMSVRATEELVRKLLAPKEQKPNEDRPINDPNIRALQDDISEKLGATVQIKHGQSGKGQLNIRYNSLDELDGILNHIK
jgi:ParB family chromosome partitioning protein